MAPTPSSPTSMLWAHQLKREHGYLLKRMQEIEASSDRQAKRIQTAETAGKSGSNADIDALAKQIKALDENGIGKRLSKLEDEMKHKTEDLEAGSEAITIQVAAMQRDSESHDEEKRKAFSREKALLKRIGEIETGLKTYEECLVQIGRRVDETRLEQIREQLKALGKQVAQEGGQMKRLAESVAVLATANEELKTSNGKLAAEIEKLAARSATITDRTKADATVGNEQADKTSAIALSPRKARKKKPHKWCGGGADRDIIMSGSQMLGVSALTPQAKQQARDGQHEDSEDDAPPTKKARYLPKQKQKHKPIPPHLRVATPTKPSNPTKSHKWSGGGTDKDIIRSGRGWIEVVASPEAEDESEGAAQKPFPHPSKRIPTPRWTANEAMTQGRTTRGGKPSQSATAKDEPKQVTGPPVLANPSSKTTKAAEKSFEEIMGQPQKRQPGKNLFTSSSAVSSPPKPRPQPPAGPTRRRRILQ